MGPRPHLESGGCGARASRVSLGEGHQTLHEMDGKGVRTSRGCVVRDAGSGLGT